MQVKWILPTVVVIIHLMLNACDAPPTSKVNARTILPKPTIDTAQIHLENVLREYHAFVKAGMDTIELPSIAYAIVKDGKILKQYTYGVKKTTGQDSIDKETVYRMASVSKTFAGVLATILVDKGVFSWEDKVRDIEPSFRLQRSANSKGMTIRHMMSHSTGLRKYAMTRDIQANKSYNSIFYNLRNAPILHEVGKVYNYQNGMFSAISKIVKRKTGHSYEKMLDSLVFQPLGMPTASVGYNPMNNNKNKAYPHTNQSRKKGSFNWQPVSLRTTWYNVNPAAGVNAGLQDMTIYLNAMLGHYPNVVHDSSLAKIFAPQIPMNEDSDYYETWSPGISTAHYGLGWRSFQFKGKRVAYHGGWLRGNRHEVAVCPSEDIGIVVMSNSGRNELLTWAIPTFFKMYFGEPKIY